MRAEAGAGSCCPLLDAVGFFGVGLFESGEGCAEAEGVLLRDGEDSDAALGAAWMADEVMASAVVGVGYGGIYDLDEGLRHCNRVIVMKYKTQFHDSA